MSLATESLRSRFRGLRVIVGSEPSVEFLAALERLVPDDEVALMVHRTLAQPTSVPKLNVLVLHRGEPVLATTLRSRQDHWEIATTAVAPTLRIPHKKGMLEWALSSIGLLIHIVDYQGDVHADFARQRVTSFTSYIAEFTDFDLEEYWRATKILADLRRAERKAVDLEFVHGEQATVDWSIDTWASRWADHPNDEAGAAEDMKAVWPNLLGRGRIMVTGIASADGTTAASTTYFVEGDTLNALITARDMTLGSAAGSIGTLVIAESFEAARKAGVRRADIGGYHDHYKRRLAPAGRTAYNVEIAPRIFSARTSARARALAGKAKHGLRKAIDSIKRRSAGE